ncbi:MAG TPA: YtxH domain-containing protein [Terriglobales bacterium]|jgi:gas vesicle protein|nr:YtxH domain-containing protein [Terriglobales bacterium]
MKGFLYGLGIGLGLGLLFAPMSGEETRSNIAQRANDLADSARETLEQGKERVRAGITAIRDAAQNVGQQATRPTGTEPTV